MTHNYGEGSLPPSNNPDIYSQTNQDPTDIIPRQTAGVLGSEVWIDPVDLVRMTGVDTEVETMEAETLSPEERVEEWLQSVADRFAATQREWRNAQRLQSIMRGDKYDPMSLLINAFPRHQRRDKTMRGLFKGGTGGLLNTIRDTAFKTSDHLDRHLEDRHKNEFPDEDAKLLSFIDHLQDSKFISGIRNQEKQYEEGGEDPDQGGELVIDLFSSLATADFMDALDYERTERFLKDDSIVRPLIDRLTEIAADPDQSEFPGLLESIAIHNLKVPPEDNLFHQAFKRVGSDSAEYINDFVNSYIIEGKQPQGKQLSHQMSVARSLMPLFFEMNEADGQWRTDLAENFIRQRDKWPAWLEKELKTYTTYRSNREWDKFEKLVEPYDHEPRRRRLKSNENTARRYKEDDLKDLANLEEIEKAAQKALKARQPEEEVRPPITNFAILKRIGAAKSHTYTQEVVDDLESVLAHDVVTNYTDKKHHGNAQIAAKIREAFDMLVTNPYDRNHTRAHTDAFFQLSEREGQLRLRRFSLQKMPGVPRSSILYDTRIYYAVVKENGQEKLLVFGVGHKNNTAKIGIGMPQL
ncbi:MAG TPA: hypothetical protein VF733_04100 [Candidatus Saccharimonadales bacterium]